MEQHKLKYIQLVDGTEIISKVDSDDWEKNRYVKLYEPLRLYSIPPFFGPDPNTGQTILLIKWLPWTDDIFVNLSIDRISVVTNINKSMVDFYNQTTQKYTNMKSSATEDFNKITLDDIGISIEAELEEENKEPENLDELAEVFNRLVKNRKRILN